jgi:hypothetical protein
MDAYLAGFFDGEGCIGMYMRKAWTLQVTVSQKDHKVLDLFNERFPEGAWCHFKNVTSLVWYGSHAFDILTTLEPLLVIKQEQAQWALKYVELSRAHKKGTPWTLGEREALAHIAEQIKSGKKNWNRDMRGI